MTITHPENEQGSFSNSGRSAFCARSNFQKQIFHQNTPTPHLAPTNQQQLNTAADEIDREELALLMIWFSFFFAGDQSLAPFNVGGSSCDDDHYDRDDFFRRKKAVGGRWHIKSHCGESLRH